MEKKAFGGKVHEVEGCISRVSKRGFSDPINLVTSCRMFTANINVTKHSDSLRDLRLSWQ
jgi:hypothetical protein